MNWEEYDLETEKEAQKLWEKDIAKPGFNPWVDVSDASLYEMRREIDKEILKNLFTWAEKEKVKRLLYKHNKKRKFKKWPRNKNTPMKYNHHSK